METNTKKCDIEYEWNNNNSKNKWQEQNKLIHVTHVHVHKVTEYEKKQRILRAYAEHISEQM